MMKMLLKIIKVENLKTCIFLDNNKKELKDTNYSVTTNNASKVKNLTIFKRKYIGIDNIDFIYEEEHKLEIQKKHLFYLQMI